ncbi:DNA repair protein XRCC4 [Elgaria multicarinata webbii]|uniref:DNA repair protein XRCC4 n=1 Tax=Elgaria multicarinata webbii TaxID=159646 RepID=UPI002FCCEDB6
MEKKVSRICAVSDPGRTYFLQIAWGEDFGTGFDVILSDGQSAWAGRVSEEEISKEAVDMEMEREKYIEELRKVLLFREGVTDIYKFDISKGVGNGECLHFSYEKNLKDVSFRLGSLTLQKVSSPAEVISELISYCLECMVGLHAKNEQLQKENERHLSDLNDTQEQLLKCVEAKEQLETDLYQRFVLVLNEKKAKIRSLLKHLAEAEEAVVKTTQASNTVATSESKVEIDDYDQSTDEESENLIQPSTSVSAKPRRDSLLSPDIIDVAPSRKRRQRTRKVASTEPKMALYEKQIAANAKLHSVSPKSSDTDLSSKGMPSEAENIAGDPEDLFDDI